MALSVNHSTLVIAVPQADLTFVSAGLYTLDTETFRNLLRDLEDDPENMALPYILARNAPVTLSGTVYSQFLFIVNGFSLEFEDGTYTILVENSNNNFADVQAGILVRNQVQVIPSNSGGLIVGEGADLGDVADAVWAKLLAGFTTEGTAGKVLSDAGVAAAAAAVDADTAATQSTAGAIDAATAATQSTAAAADADTAATQSTAGAIDAATAATQSTAAAADAASILTIVGTAKPEIKQAWTRAISGGTKMRATIALELDGQVVVLPGTATLDVTVRDAAGTALIAQSGITPNASGYFALTEDPYTPSAGVNLASFATITNGSDVYVGLTPLSFPEFS
ncbi:MAG: hypothetical protein ACTSYX_11940 [Candidatus Thorarchaeota archaeon]